jgi:hypothetical protein
VLLDDHRTRVGYYDSSYAWLQPRWILTLNPRPAIFEKHLATRHDYVDFGSMHLACFNNMGPDDVNALEAAWNVYLDKIQGVFFFFFFF